MRRSKIEVYLHIVWATHLRQALISPEIRRSVYRCIEAEVRATGSTLLAIGGTEDHVHLCVRIPATISISRFMNQMKGVSSRFVRDKLPDHDGFGWQENYAAFSVGHNQVQPVVDYVLSQELHHGDGTLHSRWEECDEPSGSEP